jgi:hypothetical protein
MGRRTKSKLGPRNADERAVFAEEGLRVDLQQALHDLMKAKRVKKRELLRKMKVPMGQRWRSLELLWGADDAIPINLFVRAFLVLGHELQLTVAKRKRGQ